MNAPTVTGSRGGVAASAPTSWAALVEGLHDATWVVEPRRLRVVAVNERALALLGRRREQVLHAPAAAVLATPEDEAYWREAALGRDAMLCSQAVLVDAEGGVRHVLRRIARLGGPAQRPPFMVTVQDQTELRQRQAEGEATLAQWRAVLESTAEALLVTDLEGRIRWFNRRFAALWRLPPEMLARRDDEALFAWMRSQVEDGAGHQRRVAQILADVHLQCRDRLLLLNGQALERTTQPQVCAGVVIGRVWSFRVQSAPPEDGAPPLTLALTDALTGLANRRQLAERVAFEVARWRRDNVMVALVVLDLDRFKQLNDSLGHRIGDAVLCELAARLRACVRDGDLVARVDGDQFALLLPRTDARGAEVTARRVLDAVAAPFDLEGAAFMVTASVGIAVCPQDGDTDDELLAHAESAMQRAKQGRAGIGFHRAAPDAGARAALQLEQALRRAVAEERFRLHYQPQVEVRTGRLVGAEALIRWRDPEFGEVPPGRFIPLAEDAGLIVAIGDWVLRTAALQAAAWLADGFALPVAVNVSALQFQQPTFVDRVAHALVEAGLPARLLVLELTEGILLRDADEALARLHELAQLGVQLAIDDFGTGYSSLSYLKRFPIQKLKIDRSFVRGLPADDSDAGIVRAILQMAQALRMSVIAEGVETEAQRLFLHEAGCEQFQGFLVAPGLEPAAFRAHLCPGPELRALSAQY